MFTLVFSLSVHLIISIGCNFLFLFSYAFFIFIYLVIYALSVPSDGSPGCSLFICCCVVLFFTLFLHLLDVFLVDVLFEFEIIRLFAMTVGSVFDLV